MTYTREDLIADVTKEAQAQFYYEWGNEPTGCVSTGCYNERDEFIDTGYMAKSKALTSGLVFNNPHP